ncbi:MAG: hypothetical protein FJY75_11655 [Candidatus Eisenbacteria bacterium]|uniref:Spore coat protein U domain-containing protein n=1 Tax=Eiseniibacteriota bacterium TaxID=2212470 RepID=A0A938BS68_UNCEI|nr:hypothetical protein [Candidatus Eisenbacteria bacterium]
MRLCTLIAAALLLAAGPASGTVYVTNGSNPQNVQINLTIGCYTQVYWNSAADQVINFGGSDWGSPTLLGAYTGSHNTQDAWATGYFESVDTAYFWLDSNCNTTMTLSSSGDLKGTGTGHMLPTWFTMCLTNNTGGGGGFIDGGVRQACETIPFDGVGCYAADDNGDFTIELFPNVGGPARFPNQYPFPMAGVPVWTAGFLGHAQGTILFHARVLRSGMADPADTYQTSLAVNFF